MNAGAEDLRKLPGVDKILATPEIMHLLGRLSRDRVVLTIQRILDFYRRKAKQGEPVPSLRQILDHILKETEKIRQRSLRPVFNATGIIIHTNLGRAPLGKAVLNEVMDIMKGYSNLEYDLHKAARGSRYAHVTDLLIWLTGAEDVLVVNNNAAAIMLILRTLAKNKEVIISRGELIEIGGSFRMPEIMEASDCKMVEVGTTNKTSLRDFRRAIGQQTATLLKVHKSNYIIQGFTEEVTLKELVSLGKESNLTVVDEKGSGLLRKVPVELLKDEPDVRQTLASGIDLVCFSGDKLLGGPQAGIIAGKKKLIDRLKQDPMNRALRVGKTTLAMLEACCRLYLDDKQLLKKNPVFSMLTKTPGEIQKKAVRLQNMLKTYDIHTAVLPGKGHSGGGSLPGKEMESYTVRIESPETSRSVHASFAERMFRGLLDHDPPVVALLIKGQILLDVLTLFDEDITDVARIVSEVHNTIEP